MISARNQLKGTVVSIKDGAVSSIISLKTETGDTITATVTVEAVKELGLEVGKGATAIIKSTEVLLGIGALKLSARNQLSGEIVSIQEGAVNAVVTLKTDGGSQITSVISIAAVKELGLAAGIEATAIVKATSVMIGV